MADAKKPFNRPRVGGDSQAAAKLKAFGDQKRFFAAFFTPFSGKDQSSRFFSDLIKKTLAQGSWITPHGTLQQSDTRQRIVVGDRDNLYPEPFKSWEDRPEIPKPAEWEEPSHDYEDPRRKKEDDSPGEIFPHIPAEGLSSLNLRDDAALSILAVDVVDNLVLYTEGGIPAGLAHLSISTSFGIIVYVDVIDALEFMTGGVLDVTLYASDTLKLTTAGVPLIKLDKDTTIKLATSGVADVWVYGTDVFELKTEQTCVPRPDAIDAIKIEDRGGVGKQRISNFWDAIFLQCDKELIVTPWEVDGESVLKLAQTHTKTLSRKGIHVEDLLKIDSGVWEHLPVRTPLQINRSSAIKIADEREIDNYIEAFDITEETAITLNDSFVDGSITITDQPGGENLLINSGFENGLTGWNIGTGLGVSIRGGVAEFTALNGGTPQSFAMLWQQVPTKCGVHYKLQFDVKAGNPRTTTFAYAARPFFGTGTEPYWSQVVYSDWGQAPTDFTWRHCWTDNNYPKINGLPYMLYCYGIPLTASPAPDHYHLYNGATDAGYTMVGLGVYNFQTGDKIYFDNVVFAELPKGEYPDHEWDGRPW